MTTIKKILTILVFTLLTGELAMAKDFTQVQNQQYLIATIPTLTNLREPSGVLFTKKSPLKALLYANQNGNQIEFQLTLQNPLDAQWFYKKHDREYFVFINEQGEAFNWYPPARTEPGFESVSAMTDDEYSLIEPHEMLTFDFSIPAKFFFTHYKNRNIFISYIDSNLPPSLENSFNTNENEKGYMVVLLSNQIKVRCYDYNEAQDRYYCDVETLPNLPVFK